MDVAFIFPDFDADENDPANYDFAYTDACCKAVYDYLKKMKLFMHFGNLINCIS